jgi:hypothetical protein
MNKTGYSSTPLAKKLGIKQGFQILLINEPDGYMDLFTDFPEAVDIAKEYQGDKDLIHYFTTEAKLLLRDIQNLKKEIKQNGIIWISWPKKSSGVPTDLTEDLIRAIALQNGLVDIKVCAVDQVWSGLKLVIPVKDRLNKADF